MDKKHAKRKQDIKSKLIAAICMLLVSSIMMVSSTYAWFTLSTAPEVTGITTAVGANGNLEMALLPKDGSTSSITSNAGDGVLDVEKKNVTWGNLVDVSDSTVYGLNQITLYPAELNVDDTGAIVTTAFLKTPVYGADGRISQLQANTFTSYLVNGSFAPNEYYGVRAVGTSSGMTDRQLDYRNARSTANSAKLLAAKLAGESLDTYGSALANIAIEHGMGGEEAYDATDVAALEGIINDLKKTDGILAQLDKAYVQYVLAYAASAITGESDAAWTAVKNIISNNSTINEVLTAIQSLEGVTVTLPTELTTAVTEYNKTVAAVTEAATALATLKTRLQEDETATFTWTEISSAMTPLANPNAMKVNGYEVSEVKNNLGAVVSSVTSQGGLIVTIATGGGVYADIADQAGDFTAEVMIKRVEYQTIVLENMAANMNTASTVVPSYLSQIGTAVEKCGAPASAAEGTMPLSDMFGYVIDLAFRTNAAESNLLLQVDATDRIYGNDNNNEETMGGGSSMTFKATSASFSDNQVKSLMSAIRIVFFDPSTGEIFANAKLDSANATMGEDGWTAEMYLYTTQENTVTTYEKSTYDADSETTYYQFTEVEDASTASGTLYVLSGDVYVAQAYTEGSTAKYYTMAEVSEGLDENSDVYTAKVTSNGTSEVEKTDNVIMALTQNQAHAMSVLVYLDGNLVGNDDVAATAATSMTGTMNLQFASSATLVPMDYADLHIAGNGSTTESSTTSESTGG